MKKPNRRRWTQIRVNFNGVSFEAHDVSFENDIKRIFSLIECGNYNEALDFLDDLPIMDDIRSCNTFNDYELIERLYPHKYPELCHMRASILTRLERDFEAIEWYQKAINADPNAAEPLADKAGCHYRLGDFNAAFECSKKAVAISANDPLAWEWMASSLRANGQNEQAINALNLGINSTERHPSLLLAKASILAEENYFKEALQLTEEVLSQNPDNETALYNSGLYLCIDGRPKDALEQFLKCLKLNKEAARGYIWREIGVTLAVLNKSDAEDALLKALDYFPGDETITKVLCAYYLRKGEPQKTKIYLNRALQINPQSEELTSLKNEVLRQVNEK